MVSYDFNTLNICIRNYGKVYIKIVTDKIIETLIFLHLCRHIGYTFLFF
jgi:hypothetical protein